MATRSLRRAERRPAGRHDRFSTGHAWPATTGTAPAETPHLPLLDVLARIHQLQRLRRRGQITGWEYLRRRSQLLDCI